MKNTIFLALIFLIVSCATQKNNQKPLGKFDDIEFGSLGGVTGVQKSYVLKADGDVYKISDEIPFLINKVNKTELRKISKQLKLVSFYDLELNETGNMTYFIKAKWGDFSNKISWGSASESKELIELYKKLTNTLKTKQNE